MHSIPRDVKDFLDEYPDGSDNKSLKANLEFYSNLRRCRPDNLLIEEIHEQWQGDYNTLEYGHGFIQWLFPIREYGMNFQSQPLQLHEIHSMKEDPKIIQRLIESYKLMLDFYGMQLVDQETGELDRPSPPRKYTPRYKNLIRSTHNNLRISRILKCLSEFGLERFNAGFLLYVLAEQSESQELNSSALHGSMDRWWANCVRNEEERAWIAEMITRVRARDGYVFTKKMYKEALERRKQTGSFRADSVEAVPNSEQSGDVERET
ncbi:hypothetical protein K435DRAFT_724883 [Dendrothele bispora CBS 962.96]|uniref:Opioid growth factor receptor (OGFr) conserved domain-containing protein n=1 Tax=Dendrothele bispora (strain CBS 962.96) TaxID=1314807 RepID=A0A4S8LWY4_DENBC|nr:hypothetical protein K435DRAFT_724883 [Dendrothele bispora CBS 962.96]